MTKNPNGAQQGVSKTENDDSRRLASTLLQIRSASQSPEVRGSTFRDSNNMPQQDTSVNRSMAGDFFHRQVPQGALPSSQFGASPHQSPTVGGMTIDQALASLRAGSGRNLLSLVGGGGVVGDRLVGAPFSPNSTQMSTPLPGQSAPNPSTFLSSLDFASNRPHAGISVPVQPNPPSAQTDPEIGGSRDRADSMVRKEQVAAALKSKPQRGRKREDLNRMERLELTRTRNREHAKTTRMRKKARYEELLQEERLLQDFQKQCQLEKARRSTVVQYVKARQQMISRKGRSEDSTSSDGTAPTGNGCASSVQDLVEDIDNFVFQVENETVDQGLSTHDRMDSYDDNLAARIEKRFGNHSLALLQYAVRQGDDGVCLDRGSGGTAEIDVFLSTDPHTPLLTGFLRFGFSRPDSAKLSSVSWSPMKDHTERELDVLKAQVSHPSVVSLDPAVRAEGATFSEDTALATSEGGNEDGQNGPGMSL